MILIDKRCFQPVFHLEPSLDRFGHQGVANPSYQNRISRFLELISEPAVEIRHEVLIDDITEATLSKSNCLIILTRAEPFTEVQLQLMRGFVAEKGHSILLMSNHDPHEKHDHTLSSQFGVTLTGGYWSGERGKATTLSGGCLQNHPILGVEGTQSRIENFVTNTTCRIVSEKGFPFMYLPDSMVGGWSSDNEAPIQKRVFGLAIDGQEHPDDLIKGKLVVLGDSGFIGDKGSTVPGLGLIDHGDNEQFVRNLIRFICP